MDVKFENQIQRYLTIVRQILESTIEDRKTVQEATRTLEALSKASEKHLTSLKADVSKSIDAVANRSAAKAAELLSEHFNEADKAALVVKERYEHAAKRLGWKMFGFAALCLLLAFGLMALAFIIMVPSYEEIDARRQEVRALEANLAGLKLRGALLQVTTCNLDNGVQVACVRTDERQKAPWGEGGETYRIIWSK